MTGCASDEPGATSTATLAVWMTPTASATPTVAPISQATSTPPPPSPTPFTYSVRESDTLIGIAVRFGVTLDALRAANPQVNERFLSIGQSLIIPLALAATPESAAATPFPLELDPPRCYLQVSGSAWCLSQIGNPGQAPVESILVEFTVHDARGRALLSFQVPPPFEQLAPGGILPVGLLIAGPLNETPRAEVRLVRAVAVSDAAAPAVPVEILEAAPTTLDGGLEVHVRARLAPAAAVPATSMRALLVLYNSRGQIVGWHTLDVNQAWAIGEVHDLRLRAYTLSDTVARHDVMIEARP
jgi:LysM repeat protein